MEAVAGRARELALVGAATEAAACGRGHLVLVGGPAGIGKTTLAEAAAEDATRRGLAVSRGHAVDDPGAPPLWPWRRAMRSWSEAATVPRAELGESDAQARFLLFEAMADALRTHAQASGLLLVLEDLHWADALSVLALRYVASEIADVPVVVLATYRDGVAGPFRDVLPDLLRGEVSRPLLLHGLSEPEITGWLPTLIGWADTEPAELAALAALVHERTSGNPLFVRLLAEGLTGDVDPDALLTGRPGLRRLIGARVVALPAATRELVSMASVLGERVPVDVLAQMVDRAEDDVRADLQAAIGAGVLVETANGVAFTHALVRDAVYQELDPPRTTQAHRAAATALAAADAPAGPVATHWERAGGRDALLECARWAELADDQSREALAHDDAARFAELAVTSARALAQEPAELSRLLIRLAEAQASCAGVEAAAQSCAEAADLAEGAGRLDLLARAGLAVTGYGSPVAIRTAEGICRRALTRINPADPAQHTVRARLLAQVATGTAEQSDGPRALTLSASALACAEESGDDHALLEALAARHLVITSPATVTERLQLGRRAIEVTGRDGPPIAALWGHLWRADAAMQLGNLAELTRETESIDDLARTRGSVLASWHGHRHRAARAALVGDFVAARTENALVREIGVRVRDVSLTGLSYAFSTQLCVVRGTIDELPPDWAKVLRSAPDMPLIRLTFPTVHAVAGDLELARAEFEEFRHLPRTLPVGVRWAGTLTQVWHVATLLEDAEVAADLYDAVQGWDRWYSGDGSGVVFTFGSGARVLADCARVAGRHDDALRHYRDAVAMNQRVGARPHTALARLGWARTLLTAGLATDPETGATPEALLSSAAAELERLDMPGPLALARSLGAAPDGSPPSPLTPREDEITALVAQALSNREIAGRLFVSERTVETHVRHVLGKLDLTTRVEIAMWEARRRAGAR